MLISYGRNSLAGTHLTGVYLEAAVPKPAALKLRPRPISSPLMSPELTRVVVGRQIDTVTRLYFCALHYN
jgi:hypothetical protein